MEVADTLAFLTGSWRLVRQIEDHRAATVGSFAGSAVWLPRHRRCGVADYEEVGELRYGAYRGPAKRRLTYVGSPDGAVAIEFVDGRPFVGLDLRAGGWRSEHRCGEDRYQIATTVVSSTVVRERWQVRGPSKDYEAVTTLVRTRSPG
jgi:hypothetical protein